MKDKWVCIRLQRTHGGIRKKVKMEDWETEIKKLTKALKRKGISVTEKHNIIRECDELTLLHHTAIIEKRLAKDRERAFKILEERGAIFNISCEEVKENRG